MNPTGELELTLAWPTLGTRATLAESVRGFAANASEGGHRPFVLIALDEASPATIAEVESLLAGVRSEFGFSGRLVTSGEQTEILADAGRRTDPEALMFAAGIAPGGRRLNNPAGNHNLCRLLTAGRRLVSTDDDVLARLARSTGRQGPDEAPVFSKLYLPAALRFCRSREEVMDTVVPYETDIVAAHLGVLGRSAEELFGSEIPPGTDPNGRVLISTAGAYGDCASSSARTILSLDGEDRDFAFHDDASYEAIRYTRELVRIPNATVVGPGTHLMGMHMGLDNRQLLPPFFPLGRNSDGLSSVMTRLVHRQSLSAFLDFGVYHTPAGGRSFTREDLVGLRTAPTDFVMALLVRYRPDDTMEDPADRVRDMGATLVALADAEPADFADMVHESWCPSFEQYANRLEELITFYSATPASWAADAREHLARVDEMLEDPDSLWGESGCGVSIEGFREATSVYGRLLQAWPEVWAAAAAAQ